MYCLEVIKEMNNPKRIEMVAWLTKRDLASFKNAQDYAYSDTVEICSNRFTTDMIPVRVIELDPQEYSEQQDKDTEDFLEGKLNE